MVNRFIAIIAMNLSISVDLDRSSSAFILLGVDFLKRF